MAIESDIEHEEKEVLLDAFEQCKCFTPSEISRGI